ncbi:type I-U CRISPR-associated RAMP protein Csb1/Cas7u [Rhodocyclus purpureus]|uniref:type I-G CRISPR-associated RAMP protein Csb1/Cas7g n=1 Tax=Rhodocyclus purpureus TaxID=1067 RepID=UPI0019122310|nr:type I-U CRISPR-associated RAMP protein Csb1/Cas7u [Rhodocyclus purpureus]MBK5914357.1 type I-U CRISPR-associated protein Cas7 [Rhodocyclus purpureus]
MSGQSANRVSDPLYDLLHNPHAVALVSRQQLRPVEGEGTPVFPPTYLGSNDNPTYCISPLGGERNLCVVDSVQSQANRVEQVFLQPPYRALVREVSVTARLANQESRTLDMLELGHRLADAAVAFSTLAGEASAALRSFKEGPDQIAKLSPMSLLLGLWESRGEDSQLKIPRAFSASISARDVRQLRRMATFTGSFWSRDLGLEGKHSAEGLDPVPAGEALGGVIADGEIVRTATLNLIALRQNCKVGSEPASAAARYIASLGLVALTLPPYGFLRQGCLLVGAGPVELKLIARDGSETAFALTHDEALVIAQAAATAFGVHLLEPKRAEFDTSRVTSAKAAKEKPVKPAKDTPAKGK